MENNFRLPAEWEKHDATWLTWPQNEETWFDGSMKPCLESYAQFVDAIQQGEIVNLFVHHEENENKARSVFDSLGIKLSNVKFHHKLTNDSWIRDYGPDFLVSNDGKELLLLDWQYNAWGGKYPPYDLDNEINTYIAEYLNVSSKSLDFILEGGSFDPNGKGVILTTEACLLNKNRNSQFNKIEIEEIVKDQLCQEHIIWLEDGIVGDDTDGHVDDFTRFIGEKTIVTAIENTSTSANHEILTHNRKLLQREVDKLGSFEILEIPMPQKDVFFAGSQLPASYLNFYISNHAVVVPIFNDVNDKIALEVLQSHFKDRKVVGVDSTNVVVGLGSFHCLSKHQPSIIK